MAETCFDSPRWAAPLKAKDRKSCLPPLKITRALHPESRDRSTQATALEERLDRSQHADKRLRELLEAWHTETARPSPGASESVELSVLVEQWGRLRAALAEAAQVAVVEISLTEQFLEQANKWTTETEHLSSPAQMMMHPSYQAILGMARGHEDDIIRLMLRDMRDNRRPWFWALSYLTHDNPIKPTDAGKLDKMVRAWVDWGLQRGKI